jgi:hypothetical protein
MTTLPTPDLAARLRNWAAGLHSTEAAVELLIAHGSWLHRPDFVGACINTFDAYDYLDGIVPVARIDFDKIPAFLTENNYSGSEARIAQFAAQIAETDTGTPLAQLMFQHLLLRPSDLTRSSTTRSLRSATRSWGGGGERSAINRSARGPGTRRKDQIV